MGNVVTGDRFWDRQSDMDLLTEKIQQGANILLVAQRRIGKTSILKELCERLATQYTCIFVDLEAAKNSREAIADLSTAIHKHKSLWDKTKGIFANVLDRIENLEAGDISITLSAGLTSGNWMSKGDQVFKIMAAAEKPVVIMFDELPILINNMLKGEDFKITNERKDQADHFLSWLRKNTITHQGKVCTIISGSIGLEPILRQARLSATINHLQAYELKSWDEKTAIACIKALAGEYKVTLHDGVPKAMVGKLGCCIPHHVQMFFSRIYDHCRRKGKLECSTKEVGRIYRDEMLSVRGHAELSHYEERLVMVLGKDLFTFALDMLSEAAVTGYLTQKAIIAYQNEYNFEGQDIVEVQKEILWVLEHDGYLEQKPKGYIFVSKLLRDWWKNRHSVSYTPVLER